MLYVYVELRYLRQLNRICPEVPAAFFSALSATVKKNGGAEAGSARGTLYSFEDRSVGAAFAVSRVIDELRALLEKHRERIREYFVLIGCLDSGGSFDSYTDLRSPYEAVILPDEGIFITADAFARLSSYVSSIPHEGSGLQCYTGHKALQYAVPERSGELVPFRITAYPAECGHGIGSLVDLLSTLSPEVRLPEVADVERDSFAETGNACEMYRRLRFSPHQPEYRVSACVDHLWYVLRSLAQKAGCPVEIVVYGDRTRPEYLSLLTEKLGSLCRIREVPRPDYMPFDLKNIPQDLLELSYIVYRARQYLCHDEIPAFFAGMGKEAEFVGELGNWMYSFGLLSDPADFRSINPQAAGKLRDTLEGRTGPLDRHIATFLWSMYEQGALQSDFSLYEVFASLSLSVPDAFLVGCLYSVRDPCATARAVSAHFADPEIPESVIALETARRLYDAGQYDEAIVIAKKTLHTFQQSGILPGEYRVLSLIAMLSLARDRADDAIVYLEYALENAERMHDPRSSLSTRFSMAMAYFIIGNYHFALCNLESVNRIVETCYAKDWEVLILFMKGRILFELGNYTDAELLFQTAASLASVYQIPESVSLSRVWYARSLVHEGRYATADAVLRDCAQTIPEAWIFLLESAILSGHPLSDFPAQRPDFPFDRIDYDGPESFSWRSGFSIAENLRYGADSPAGVAGRMYDAFALVYRYRFVPGVDGAESARLVSQLARSAMDSSDPNTDLYYYFCYDIGKDSCKPESSDAMVFLSRAFKFMQKRANEIEDNNLREQFMQNPTWNTRLWREARIHMLI